MTAQGATYPNQILDVQIKSCIDSQLATKGLTRLQGATRHTNC